MQTEPSGECDATGAAGRPASVAPPLFQLTLAGTTSSGKSTVFNLLAGRFLSPVGVQETTRALVDLFHDPEAAFPVGIDPVRGNLKFQDDRSCRQWLRSRLYSGAQRIEARAALGLGPSRRWYSGLVRDGAQGAEGA